MKPRQSLKLRLTPLHRQVQFQSAVRLIQSLRDEGFETVFAGGCVRDSLLGVVPKDLDIATAAPPTTVETLFPRTLAVGKAFGTIVVIEDGHNFEVTTFRREGGYTDGRHPSQVEFTDLAEDASRRDFTVNALFYDPLEEKIIDCVNGMQDLSDRRLRTVGRAEERFAEDYLRMLRAPRFVAQLGFALDEEASNAIHKLHHHITQVSAERIFMEMRRLLSSQFLIQGLSTLRATQLEVEVWPEARPADFNKLSAFMPFLGWENAFAAITLLAGGTSGEPRLRAWKAPRESMKRVQQQIDGCRTLQNPDAGRAARARIMGGEVYAETLQLARGFHGDQSVKEWIQEYLDITGPTGVLPKPFLNGQDLLASGIPPGEKMGVFLKTLYDEQLAGKLRSKDEALERLKTLD